MTTSLVLISSYPDCFCADGSTTVSDDDVYFLQLVFERLGCATAVDRLRYPGVIPVFSSVDLERRLTSLGLSIDIIKTARCRYEWNFRKLLPDLYNGRFFQSLCVDDDRVVDSGCDESELRKKGQKVVSQLKMFIEDLLYSDPWLNTLLLSRVAVGESVYPSKSDPGSAWPYAAALQGKSYSLPESRRSRRPTASIGRFAAAGVDIRPKRLA